MPADVFPADPAEFDFLPDEAREWQLPGQIPPVARVDAGPLSALRWGNGEVDTVFLHGVGLNAHTFDATVLALAGIGQTDALSVDLPGHGDSAWDERADYSPQALAGPVAQALSGWSPGPKLLVGQSLGGLTALRIAARRPELVSSLVIIDITPGLVMADAAQVTDFLAVTDFASRDDIVDRAAAFGLGASRESLVRGVHLNTRVRPDGRVVFKHHLANLRGLEPPVADLAELWPDAESLQVPVLLVRAEQGFLSDAVVGEFLDRVLGADLVTVPGGHNIQEQHPVELARIIAGARRR